MKANIFRLAGLGVLLWGLLMGSSSAENIHYVYDNLNRVVRAESPDGTVTTFDYDPAQNRTTSSITLPLDSDGDGLSNYLEGLAGTNPNNPDSDGDGLTDGEEDANRNGWTDIGESSPLYADTNTDGLSDGLEVALGLNTFRSGDQKHPGSHGSSTAGVYQAGAMLSESDLFSSGTSVPSFVFWIAGFVLFLLAIWGRKQGIKLMIRLLGVLGLFLTIAIASPVAHAFLPLPEVKNVSAPPVSPSEAQAILGDQKQALLKEQAVATSRDLTLLSASQSSPDIQSLARGLKNDPDLIYEYVYNNIKYTPIFGSVKGASATLIDGRGNDFDQASLMIALLREAGYTANYVYGVVEIWADDVANWLGIDTSFWDPVSQLLGSAGIPFQGWVYQDGSLAFIRTDHVWVRVNIGGTDYDFDPSFKTHNIKAGINIQTALGYDRTTFLSNAMAGTATGSDYLQDVNHANIAGDLTTYASNLITEIQTNHPGATLGDILGEKKIVPNGGPVRQTAHPNLVSVTAVWSEVPANYRTTLRIQHVGIDSTLYSDEIYGKRLTIFYNASNQPVLRLDGTVIATGTAATPDTHQEITCTVDHPYAANSGTYCDQSRTFYILAGGSYAIHNGFGDTARNMVEHHRKILSANRAAGGADTDEEVLGETLAMMSSAYLAESTESDQLMDRLFRTVVIHHHEVGIAGQNQSPYIDIPMALVSVCSEDANEENRNAGFFSAAGRGSAFEWGVIEQHQPNSAVCTVKLIDIANRESNKIFDVTSANYASIKPQLTGYSANELASVENYLSAGYRVILPENGDLTETQWQGMGFLAISSDGTSIGHIISGGLKGGYADVPYTADSQETVSSGDTGISATTHAQSSEPIDLVTGDYLYDYTDLTLGNGPYPFSLGFRRSYNSDLRLQDGAMGKGWTHNFEILASEDSDGFLSLGERSAIEAAAVIAEIYVSTDLLKGTKTNDRVVVATLAHRWFMDRLIDNVVTVQQPGKTKRFVKLADRSYNSPPGEALTLTLEVDSSFLLQTKHGAEMDFDPDGRLITWTDKNGNQATLTYSSGQLQSIANGMGRTLNLAYTDGRITQVSDGTGRSTNYHYDVDGNLVRVTDAEGHDTVFEYDLPGRLTKIFYPANPLNAFVTNTYGNDDRVNTQTDANGNAWQYYFTGFRAEEVNPLGDAKVYYFDSHGNTIREINALGNETVTEYNGHQQVVQKTFPEGNFTSYQYDDRHNPVLVSHHPKPGATQSPLEESFTYDAAFNQVLTATDAMGRTTTFSYDVKGNLERVEQPPVNTLTPVTLFTYNARGQVLTKTDPEGRVTRNTYDVATANLLSIAVDDGGLGLTTQFAYDAVGNVTSQTDPMGRVTALNFDNMRRKTQQTDPAPFSYITQYDYDADGHLIQTRRETGDPLDPWQTVSVSYTLSGKKHVVTDPEGHTTTHAYDAVERLWKITNAVNQVTEYHYDANGRIFQVVDNSGAVSEEHQYTVNGLQASLRDANSNLTRYIYDPFDRLDRVTFPDSSYEAFTYDNAGNVLQKQTRSGQTISYTYDPLNRMDSKVLPGPATTTYAYDLSGLLKDVTDSRGTIHHDYDGAIRLTSVTYPDAKTIGYQYDANSNQTRLTYPDGAFVDYGYDELNRLADIHWNGTTLIANYDYDALSRRTILTYANGTSTTYSYQIDDDLASLAFQNPSGTSTFSYTTNTIGLRTDVNADDYRFVFNPDTNGPSGSTTYSANILNQYTAVGGVAFSYDGNGNLTSDGANTYTYDAENHLLSATAPGVNASFVYDPMGRRVEKNVNGQVTEYLHDGNHVIVEYDGSSQEQRRYIYGQGIDQPICMITATATYYYMQDGLGSVVALTDDSGSYVEIYAYTPYGKPNGDSWLGNTFLYTARAYDAETGLYYYRARYYDPQSGRFLQVDPIGYDGGMNLYAYVLNNPIIMVDPYGLIRWGTVGKGALAAFGGGVAVFGGALASTTGVGAVGGVPAVLVGSAGVGWGVSQMIAGFLDNEIPFMGTKEAIIKGSTEPGLLQDELLAVNTLGDMLLTGRTAPTDIGKINDVLQSGYSIYESGSKIVDSIYASPQSGYSPLESSSKTIEPIANK